MYPYFSGLNGYDWRQKTTRKLPLVSKNHTKNSLRVLGKIPYFIETFPYSHTFLPPPQTSSIAGGNIGNEHVDTILEFEKEAETWSEVGHMKQKRGNHALSVVNFSDFEDWCQ